VTIGKQIEPSVMMRKPAGTVGAEPLFFSWCIADFGLGKRLRAVRDMRATTAARARVSYPRLEGVISQLEQNLTSEWGMTQ